MATPARPKRPRAHKPKVPKPPNPHRKVHHTAQRAGGATRARGTKTVVIRTETR